MSETLYRWQRNDGAISRDEFEAVPVAEFEQIEWCAEHDEQLRLGRIRICDWASEHPSDPCRPTAIWIQKDRTK